MADRQPRPRLVEGCWRQIVQRVVPTAHPELTASAATSRGVTEKAVDGHNW